MREGINPTWESPENKDGGCFSFKIYRQDIHEAWNELSYLLVGENILKEKGLDVYKWDFNKPLKDIFNHKNMVKKIMIIMKLSKFNDIKKFSF